VIASFNPISMKEHTAVKKENIRGKQKSRVDYEVLESWVREQMQELIQGLLEEEVEELLGRQRYERKKPVDAVEGYRNGYGKRRHLTLSCGTVQLRRPRVRGLEERFVSRILPLFVRRTREVADLLPELYLHGLAEGDFDLALRGLLGEKAPLSGSTVARLKEKWQAEYSQWKTRSLKDLQIVYVWVDGLYVKAGLEKEKAAVLTVVASLSDGSKEILQLGSGYRESKESWVEVLRDLKKRGIEHIPLVVADGHLGIWAALPEVYPLAREQRCWNHKELNVLDQVPRTKQAEAKLLLTKIPYSRTRTEAEKARDKFEIWCKDKGFTKAAEILSTDWDRMVTFYSFPKEHWLHIRTTNVVESPFAALRLRTDAAKRFKKVENATAVIWKMLLIAEKRFRKLNAPELLKEVYEGVEFVDGIAVTKKREVAA
jgi:transposase-like protein